MLQKRSFRRLLVSLLLTLLLAGCAKSGGPVPTPTPEPTPAPTLAPTPEPTPEPTPDPFDVELENVRGMMKEGQAYAAFRALLISVMFFSDPKSVIRLIVCFCAYALIFV